MRFGFSSGETEVALTLAVVAVAMGELALQSLGDESRGIYGFTVFRFGLVFLNTTAEEKFEFIHVIRQEPATNANATGNLTSPWLTVW